MKIKKILPVLTLFVMAAVFFSQTAIAQTAQTPSIINPSGTIFAWGFNNNGQIGIDTPDETVIDPSQVMTDIIYFSGGQDHTLFVKSDSTLWSFGSNSHGQLGIGDSEITAQPSPVQVDEDVIYVSGGISTTHYIKSDGTLWAMGDNTNGMLGVETGGDPQYSPIQVEIADNVVAALGNAINGFFLTEDGTLLGIGVNNRSQLAADPADVDIVLPSDPAVIDSSVVDFTIGFGHVLYIKDDGSLWSIGRNDRGQLGDGTTDDSSAPIKIADDAVSVDAAARNSVYVDSDGNLYAFGRNTWGNIGDGTTDDAHSPVQVLHGENVVSAQTGQRHTIFAKADGTVWATGHNRENQMALGSEVDQITEAQQITVGGTYNNVTKVETSGAHNIVLDQTPAPPAPQNLTLTVTEETDSYIVIELNWDEVQVSDFSHYVVTRGSSEFEAETNSYTDTLTSEGVYTYSVQAIDMDGYESEASAEVEYEAGSLVSNESESGVPAAYKLGQNYPNPFNPTTTISYDVPEQTHVTLKVYNVMGQEVAELVNSAKGAGSHEVVFDAQHISSGVYFYRITAGDFTAIRKLTLIK